MTIPQAGIPLEFATLGWQESFEQLRQLVGPEIPDGPADAEE